MLLLLISFSSLAQSTDANEMFLALNNERIRHGLKPLDYFLDKQSSCDAWAQRISRGLVHNHTEAFLGEAISQCPASPELAVPFFMESPTHKRILMNRHATRVCIGVYFVPASEQVNGQTVIYMPPIYYTVIRVY